MKIFKKAVVLLLIFVFAAGTFSLGACGRKGNSDALELFVNNGDKFDGTEKDRIWLEIEEEIGAELSFIGTAHSSAYYTKLNPLMNTIRNMPDVVFVVPTSEEMGLSTFSERWTDEEVGLVYNYDELLARYPAGTYPYLEKIFSSAQYKNIMHNGGHYILPSVTSNSSWGIYFRTDWLINIGYYDTVNGVKVARYPKTLEEYTDVIRKFTFNDPDGNGVNDTYGFCPGKGEHCWNPFYNAFGVTTDWDIMEDGSLDYMYTQKEFKDFLTWANGLFNEGCIYPTFSSIQANGDRDLFYNGKIGMLITNAESHVYYIKSKMTAMGNGDKFGFAEPPVGTAALGKEGAGGFADWGGWWGGYCITKNCKNIEAALKLLDYMLSPEGAKLRTYGMEGVHYTEENGAITPVVEERAKEGGGKWEEFTVDGVSAPIGRYVMGTLFGYPVDWEEFEKSGKIEYLISAELLDPENEALVQQAFDAMRLNTSRLTNVTAYSKTAVSVMNSVQEESKAFVNNAIIGKKNLTSDWDDMIGRLKGLKWSAMENSVMETLKTLGIVE